VALKLLEEYPNVIPEELSIGLLSKREIQHHIELIPSSTLPNQAAYQLSPTQNAKLSK